MSSWKDVQDAAASALTRSVTGEKPGGFAENRNLGDCLYGYTVSKDKHRFGCKVSVFVDQGRLKASINDPNTGLLGFVTLDASVPLGDSLEGALLSNEIDWRKPKEGGSWGRSGGRT